MLNIYHFQMQSTSFALHNLLSAISVLYRLLNIALISISDERLRILIDVGGNVETTFRSVKSLKLDVEADSVPAQKRRYFKIRK